MSDHVDWAAVWQASRGPIRRAALARPLIVSAIGAFIVAVALLAGPENATAVAVGALVAGVVALAFFLEARRNLAQPPVVVVGRVAQRGLTTEWDSGGPGDAAASRLSLVPRVRVEVERTFVLLPTGEGPATTVEQPFVIDQARWFRTLKQGDRVALVCLASSFDPVHHVALPDQPMVP